MKSAVICLAVTLLATPAAHALKSQSLGDVERLSAHIRQIGDCGRWSDGARSGHYRFIVVDVSGGAGSELYVQRIATLQGSVSMRTLVDTSPIESLNDDHAQYAIESAVCRNGGLDLKAS